MQLFAGEEPKGYIFDFDGTLANSMERWIELGTSFMASLGLSTDREYWDTLVLMGPEEIGGYLVERFELNYEPQDLTDELLRQALDLFETPLTFKPGAPEYLKGLHEAGVPVALATSSHRAIVEQILNAAGLRGYFDAVCVVDDVGVGKEHPDVYLEAARQLGLPLESCVIFEDAPGALATARSTGARVVAVKDPHSSQEGFDLTALAHRVITDYRELVF